MTRIALPALIALGAALPCFAQYPDRPLTVVAGFPAGGLVDVVSRVVAEGMKPRYPKGVVVVNKPGAGGAVAVSEVVQAKPDGYTIVLTPLSSLVIGPQLNRDLSYKTPEDYDPVINVVAYYPLLVVRSDAPWKTIQEFVADGKAHAGKLRVGTPGEGTSSHLNLEEFMFKTGVKLTHVPYAGWGQSSPALLGGHIEALAAQKNTATRILREEGVCTSRRVRPRPLPADGLPGGKAPCDVARVEAFLAQRRGDAAADVKTVDAVHQDRLRLRQFA